jgi:hypothetical protein
MVLRGELSHNRKPRFQTGRVEPAKDLFMLVAATLELSQRFSLPVGDSVSTERSVPGSEL